MLGELCGHIWAAKDWKIIGNYWSHLILLWADLQGCAGPAPVWCMIQLLFWLRSNLESSNRFRRLQRHLVWFISLHKRKYPIKDKTFFFGGGVSYFQLILSMILKSVTGVTGSRLDCNKNFYYSLATDITQEP